MLDRFGLFDARVPRYTSYPPANHFVPGDGARYQAAWLAGVPEGASVSVYIHVPFCKRLCWFCACRTQGTQTLRPVQAYVAHLLAEIAAVGRHLPAGVRMSRLHLGGGTPTLLDAESMARLLAAVRTAFAPAADFVLSVEIDPTEAATDLLDVLLAHGMTRASIGVQDFAPQVQEAIGRAQSLAQTERVAAYLRDGGVGSLNLDLLYGLPRQTPETFAATLESVATIAPDRLALYGYAHVPWVSKRQVMIREADLPDPRARFRLSEQARLRLSKAGYVPVGIDHFALPHDALATAARRGVLRRNFQGYTDDEAPVLIGLGASAISRFPQGYVQNAAATSAYQARIAAGSLAGDKGYAMTAQDALAARMIEDLMCHYALDIDALCTGFPTQTATVQAVAARLVAAFDGAFRVSACGPALLLDAYPLVRIIAHSVDRFRSEVASHSAAV